MSHLEIHSAINRLKRRIGSKVDCNQVSDNIRDIEKNIALVYAINVDKIDLDLIAHLCNCMDSPAMTDNILSSTIFLHGLSVVYKIFKDNNETMPVVDRLYTSISSRLRTSPFLISKVYCKEYFLEYCHHAKDILPYLYDLFQNDKIDLQHLLTNYHSISNGPLNVFTKPRPCDPLIVNNLTKLVRFGTNESLTCATLLAIVSNHCPTWYLDYLIECVVQNSKFPDITLVVVVYNMFYLIHHYPDLKSKIFSMVESNIHILADKSTLIAVGELIANCVPFDSVAWLYSFLDSSQSKGIPIVSTMYISCGFISCHVDQPKTLDLAISQLLRVVTKSLKRTQQTDSSIKTLSKEMSLKITRKLNEQLSSSQDKVKTLPLKSMVSLTNFDEQSDPLFVVITVLTIIGEYIIGSCGDYVPKYLCAWQFNQKHSESIQESIRLFEDILQNLADVAQGQSTAILNKNSIEASVNGPVHDALYLHVLDSFIDLSDAGLHTKYNYSLLNTALNLFEYKSWNILKLVDDKELFMTYIHSFALEGNYSFESISKIAQKELLPIVPLIEKLLCDHGLLFVQSVLDKPTLDSFMKSIPNYNEFVSQFRVFWVFYSLFNFNCLTGEIGESFSRIAFYSPVLFPAIISQDMEENNYKKTLDYNPYREHFTSDVRLGLIGSAQVLLNFGDVYKQRLKLLVGDVDVRHVTNQECLHLLAIYDLEYKRVLAGRHEIINYLAAFDLSTGAQAASTSYKHSQAFILFKSCLRGCILNILQVYLNTATTTTLIQYYDLLESQEEMFTTLFLEQQSQHLLFHCCCHPLSEVHVFSVIFIEQLLNKFPSLMWSKGMLFLCLDLIQILNQSVMDITRNVCCFYYKVPSANRLLYLPDDLDHRKLVYSDLSTFLMNWIDKGAKSSESESYIVIREYIMKGQLQTCIFKLT
eukprot:NODE_378_length_9766_cov_0.333816.p1 type:complete len:926 gc:universal NODE_378_length_9766_cov_0.333816:312-3089(+)